MERIELNKNCKRILLSLRNNKYIYCSKDNDDLLFLEYVNLVTLLKGLGNHILNINLTEKGNAYLHFNPKLKNPSIWEDKKYWITTFISFVAIIISIVALCK